MIVAKQGLMALAEISKLTNVSPASLQHIVNDLDVEPVERLPRPQRRFYDENAVARILHAVARRSRYSAAVRALRADGNVTLYSTSALAELFGVDVVHVEDMLRALRIAHRFEDHVGAPLYDKLVVSQIEDHLTDASS